MAYITGEIQASDYGLTTDNIYAAYVLVNARLPMQPPEWTDAGLQRHRLQMWRQITLGATVVSIERWNGWDGCSGDDSVTGPLAASWEEYNDTPWNPARPTGLAIESVSFADTHEGPRQAANPNGPPAFLHAICATYGCTIELFALHMEMEVDEAFTASDPSSVRDYETIGRNPATWSPYNKNESVSAWLLQRILAQNLNKILYATQQAWTVPL